MLFSPSYFFAFSYLINISLAQVARVLNMAVVTHEAHHAEDRYQLERGNWKSW